MTTQKGIVTRDRWDVTTSDVIIANFFEATNVSIGTVMEIAWADLERIPVIAIMEEGNLHEHAMLNECIHYKVDTIDAAIDVARKILTYG